MERVERAEQLFSSYKGSSRKALEIGRGVIEILGPWEPGHDRSQVETRLLLKGYNWAGNHLQEFELAKASVERWGDSFLPSLTCAFHNCFWWPGDRLLAEAEKLIRQGLGHESVWRLLKVDFLLGEATGNRHRESGEEWQPGDPIVNEEALKRAAEELRVVLAQGLRADQEAFWDDDRFAPILTRPEYEMLRPSGKNRSS